MKSTGPDVDGTKADSRLNAPEATRIIPWEADARTWQFTYIGPQAKALLGYPLERWYEPDFWSSHLHPEDQAFAVDFCEKSSQTLTNYEFEYRMIAADGRVVWLHDVVNVVTRDGRPHTLRGFLIDISERRRAEENKRKAHEELDAIVQIRTRELEDLLTRYRALIDAVPDLILRMDGDNRYLDFYPGDDVRLAYRPQEFIGRTPSDLFEPEIAEAAEKHIREALESGQMQVWEYELRFDGRPRQYEARIVPSGSNEIVAFIRDVTKRNRTQEKLRLSESRLREAQRMASVGNWEWDVVTDSRWWSDETYRIFGVDPATPLSFTTFIERIHPEDREWVHQLVEDAYGDGRSHEICFRLLLPDGTLKTVESRAKVVVDENGRATRWVGVVQDVTETMKLNTKLEERNAELANRDRHKDMLLAALGHELRNPLGAIRHSLDLISLLPSDVAGNDERKLALEVIRRQSDQLQTLLNELLDHERIKYGKIDLNIESVDLNQLAIEIVDSYRDRAEKSGLALKIEVPAQPIHVSADRARLQQVLDNLLDNALRFTDEGEITVIVRKRMEEAEVAVSDTGVGIDPDETAAIFEPFYQGSHREKGADGLGFGLAVVRRLVERLGGTIDVHSDGFGTGTTFTIALKLAQPDSEDAQVVHVNTKPRHHRILVVDDEPDNANMLAALLAKLGQETKIAYDGSGALEVARAHLPQIAFLDLSMPGMDGREVAQRLRAMFSPADLMLVALTGLERSDAPAERDDPDFEHYLLKPARLEDVVNLLNSV